MRNGRKRNRERRDARGAFKGYCLGQVCVCGGEGGFPTFFLAIKKIQYRLSVCVCVCTHKLGGERFNVACELKYSDKATK